LSELVTISAKNKYKFNFIQHLSQQFLSFFSISSFNFGPFLLLVSGHPTQSRRRLSSTIRRAWPSILIANIVARLLGSFSWFAGHNWMGGSPRFCAIQEHDGTAFTATTTTT
jgi:hypothetical protein